MDEYERYENTINELDRQIDEVQNQLNDIENRLVESQNEVENIWRAYLVIPRTIPPNPQKTELYNQWINMTNQRRLLFAERDTIQDSLDKLVKKRSDLEKKFTNKENLESHWFF